MIIFFRTKNQSVIATEVSNRPDDAVVNQLCWLFGEAAYLGDSAPEGSFVGPRREMITPWSTNAVEITQNMGITGISRIEEYFPVSGPDAEHDPMLQRFYPTLNQDIFKVDITPEPIRSIDDLAAYNEQEGLALSPEEIDYRRT